MTINAGVAQTGIFVPLEFVHSIVHQGIVEYTQRYQQLKVLHRQTGDLLEQARLQLGDHVLQAALPVVRQIHEHRNAGGKLDELFLNLLALGLVLFFLVRKLLLLLRGKVFGAFLLRLFHLFGLCDDGFDVRVQAAEAFDLHQSIHGLLVGNEAGEGLIVHVHQKYAFPALCQQGGRGASHGNVENIPGVDLPHGAAIIGNDRQEIDKFRYLLFRVALVDVQTAAIIGDLPQSTVERKVEHIALFLDDLLLPLVRGHFPRALHTECGLKIGLRAGEVPQHKDACPRLHRHAGGQLAAGKGNGLGLQRVAHGTLYRLQCGSTNASLRTGADIDPVVVVEGVFPICQQVCHSVAGCHVGQEPQGMLQHVQQTGVRKGQSGLLGSQLQLVHGGFQIGTPNQVQPLLHIILVDKTAVPAFAIGGKEHVQVKFIVFTLLGDLLDAFRNLVGHHDHPGQSSVGIVLSLPVFFGTLFIGIGPVVDLLLDELAGVEGTEGGAGQIQVVVGGDGQPWPQRPHEPAAGQHGQQAAGLAAMRHTAGARASRHGVSGGWRQGSGVG